MKQQEKEKEYETYVKEKTPVRKPGPAMAKAFVTGGIICTIGQTILNACEKAGMSKTSKNTEPAYSQEKKKERPESGKESLFHMQRQMR